jgi:hypothetical protein
MKHLQRCSVALEVHFMGIFRASKRRKRVLPDTPTSGKVGYNMVDEFAGKNRRKTTCGAGLDPSTSSAQAVQAGGLAAGRANGFGFPPFARIKRGMGHPANQRVEKWLAEHRK